jgi:hypothetical protein
MKNGLVSPRPNSTAKLDSYINITLLILMVLWVYVAISSSLNVMSLVGPTSIAVNKDGQVIVALSDRFVTTDKKGNVIEVRNFEDAGITGLVNDVKLLANGDVLLGDGGSRSLYVCDSYLASCNTLQPGNAADKYDVGKYHKFYIDRQSQKIILSDTEKHQLVALNMDGSLSSVLIPKSGSLNFPDGVHELSDGHVLLANSFKHELLDIAITANEAEILNRYSTDNGQAAVKNNLPFEMGQISDDRWWVALRQNSATSDSSSVVVLDDMFKPVKTLKHEEMISPVKILDIDYSVLIADMYAYKVFSFDHEGNNGYVFGDSELNSILLDQKSSKVFNEYIRWLAIGAILLTLVIALIVESVRKKEKREADELIESESNEVGLTLTTSGSYVKMMRLMPVILLIIMGTSGFLLFGSMHELVVYKMLPMFLMILLFTVAIVSVTKYIPKSIYINDEMISVVDQKDNELSDSINNVEYSRSALWVKGNYFNIGSDGKLLKDKDGYKILMDCLKSAPMVSAWVQFKRLFSRSKFISSIAVILGVVILIIMISGGADKDLSKDKDTFQQVITSG